MPMKRRPPLTPQELAIMKIVWRLGAVTVRDVYEASRATRQIAYTTVMTMMKVLETKGYLKKDTQDRAYLYRAARPEGAVVTSMVREFVDRVFDGASRPLLLHLVRDTRLSAAERKALLRLLEEHE
jgi:BlaI family transcriptional regulator, penicillinase repressor